MTTYNGLPAFDIGRLGKLGRIIGYFLLRHQRMFFDTRTVGQKNLYIWRTPYARG